MTAPARRGTHTLTIGNLELVDESGLLISPIGDYCRARPEVLCRREVSPRVAELLRKLAS